MKFDDTKMRYWVRDHPFELKAIEYYRYDAKRRFWRGFWFVIGMITALIMPIPENLPFPPLLTAHGTALVIRFGWTISLGGLAFPHLRGSWLGFALAYIGFHYRVLSYQLETEAPIPNKPSRYYVWFKDLKAYEEEVRSYVRSYRAHLDEWIREERWENENNRLSPQLHSLLSRFGIEADQRGQILERWGSIRNPTAKKKYLGSLESRLSHEKFFLSVKVERTPDPVVEPLPARGMGETRLDLLQNQAAGLVSDESRKFLESAAAAGSRRDKIRLLKQALRTESAHSALVTSESPSVQAQKAKKVSEIQFLTLQDLARERLNLSHVVPRSIDPIMSREIILALLSPGKRGRRFQAAYRAEDTLRVMVRRQFEVYLRKQFDPRNFRVTLAWLVQQEVLFTKPKTDEQVFSLSSKTRGKSVDAQKIINAFLEFDRSLHVI